jgi:hypothetical protein
MEVAGHGLDPGIGDSDERLAKIIVGETYRLEHGACGSTVATIGNSMTAMFRIHRKEAYQTKDRAGASRAPQVLSSSTLGAPPKIPYKAAGDAGRIFPSLRMTE